MLTKLEKLGDTLKQEEIELLDMPNITVKAACVITKNGKKAIVINKKLLENSREEFTAISHEYEHLKTNSLYSFETSSIEIDKAEYKANKAMIQKLVPITELTFLLTKNYYKWEIAEIFGVTDECIDIAIEIYKAMGLLEEGR